MENKSVAEKVRKLELLVEELLKDHPSEESIKNKMTELELNYTEDPVERINRVLEALHPFLRIGAIESQLMGKFHVPTVFFYPGIRTGKTNLKFLGFYPADGNYRSVHVGG